MVDISNNVTHLILDRKFNNSLDNLPNTVTHIIFEKYSIFNQFIDYLPSSVLHIEFTEEFNKTVEKTLPQNIFLSPPNISGIINSPEDDIKTKKNPV